MEPIEIFIEGSLTLPFHNITEDNLKSIAHPVIQYLELKNVIITIILTDNKYIQSINKEFRDIDTPTDVISFSYRENSFPEIEVGMENIGDIYISLEKAYEQSNEYNVSLYDELKKLIIHGILHLTGWDHESSDSEAKRMKKNEEELFLKIGN